MSTVQKAFIFIVLVLAVLTATVQLVLFAQRNDFSAKFKEEQKKASDLQKNLNTATRSLEQVKADKSAAVADLEAELASVRTDLDTAARQLESARSDKANLETLVSAATAKLETIGQNMEALTARNDQLNTAKLNLEEELMKVKADLQDSQEQYTIASRNAKDLEEKVSSLEQQLAEKTERARNLQQEVEVLRQYYPGEVPTITAAPAVEVLGKVTGMSADRSDIYLSIGSDDGVTNGMLLIVYKANGTYAADARVFNVSAGKSAARVIKPVRATIAEGDNVANK